MVAVGLDSVQLLDVDSDSEDTSGEAAPKPRRVVRRYRFYRANREPNVKRPTGSKKHAGLILTVASIVMLVVWVLLLTLATTRLSGRLYEVRLIAEKVAAGSQGMPEEIQKCHSLSRQLQLNQTSIFLQIDLMNQRLSNFSKMIGIIQGGLNEVANKLKESPELVNVPNQLHSLKASIATLGSGFEDMKTTTGHLQETQETIRQSIGSLNQNITKVNVSVAQLNDAIKKQLGHGSLDDQEVKETLKAALLNALQPNISKMNDSLSKRIDWVSEDQKKDYRLIVELQESSANLSSQLLSLRDNVVHVSTNCSTLNSQVATLKTSFEKLSSQDVDGVFAQPNPQAPTSIQLLPTKEDAGGTMTNSSSLNIPPS